MQTTPSNTCDSLASGLNALESALDRPVENPDGVLSSSSDIHNARVMIIDDEPIVIRVVRRFLETDGYANFIMLSDSRRAMELIRSEKPDLVMLDILMPGVTGIEILRLRSADPVTRHIPFIVLSAASERSIKREALELGANEFLSKPVDPLDLSLRVRNALQLKRYHDSLRSDVDRLEEQVCANLEMVEKSRAQIIHCLAKAAEFRDVETWEHVIRVGKFAGIIAQGLGLDRHFTRQIELAAQLHDVGKIGIPDSILLNPGCLSRDEFEIMKEHCRLGYRILDPLALAENSNPRKNVRGQFVSGQDCSVLGLAANIALTHHEKWDGTGYPDGLRGEEIPVEGRITSIADVFDALCSERPYKPAFPRDKCLEIMLTERESRFDPKILDVFFDNLEQIDEISQAHRDVC